MNQISIATYTPYLALTCELWIVYCQDNREIDRVVTALHYITDVKLSIERPTRIYVFSESTHVR